MKKIFDEVILYSDTKRDSRGDMSRIFSRSAAEKLGISLDIKTLRAYDMPHRGTFVGIHYHKSPAAKLVTVVSGSGADFVVDLRPGSPTYLKWDMNILSSDNRDVIYIPHGFGHAFLSLEDNTVQIFACESESASERINYMDERIGLVLPIDVSEISEADRTAMVL